MSAETLIILVGIAIIALNAFLLWFFVGRKKSDTGSEARGLLLQQMNELTKTVDAKIGEGARQMNEAVRNQFGDSQRLIKEITRELTEVKETGKQVVSFADQLQSLQDILKNPKQRGILGEYYLETLLKNVLPPDGYKMQYSFKDGSIVDAVVFVKNKIIPIDSKFSLENYNRLVEAKEPTERERLEKAFKNDLKNRIDETAQYIKPSEDTMDFAFMFIPHEAIYYDLLVSEVGAVRINTRDLVEYAFKKHVIIISPTSFHAYLQTVLQGLKALQIEETAKEIIKKVEDLGKHIGTYDQYMISLGRSLGTTVNHYDKAQRELKKIDKDVLRITGSGNNIETLEIDKPSILED